MWSVNNILLRCCGERENTNKGLYVISLVLCGGKIVQQWCDCVSDDLNAWWKCLCSRSQMLKFNPLQHLYLTQLVQNANLTVYHSVTGCIRNGVLAYYFTCRIYCILSTIFINSRWNDCQYSTINSTLVSYTVTLPCDVAYKHLIMTILNFKIHLV